MATKTRQLADFLVAGGVSDAEIQSVPHIRPGILQPAVAGKLLDGSTSHSGNYGTAQSDGHSYYYTDIKGSKPIKDPRIGGHFGTQRYLLSSAQKLEQETATHGANVYRFEGREWVRGSGAFGLQNDSNGIQYEMTGTTTFIEITGYFSDANIQAFQYTTDRHFTWSVDGGSGTVNTAFRTSRNIGPLGSRFLNGAGWQNIGLGATLGIHTLKILSVEADAGAGNFRPYAFELIAQDTSSTANRSKIQIPAQNVVSYGKKFSISGTPHYDPFNGMSGAKTLAQLGDYIDTATSLGMENWKGGTSNYYKPFNGGRVVRWVANDGTIKTSVTMMPPNAQNVGGIASNAVSDAHIQAGTNDDTINFDTTTLANATPLSEVAKTFHWREFGNGAANQGAEGTRADASMLNTTADDIGYVMDDGLTSLSGNDVDENTRDMAVGGTDDGWYITFIGTGLTVLGSPHYQDLAFSSTDDYDFIIDGVTVKEWVNGTTMKHIQEVCQNLPYGTHIFQMKTNANAGAHWMRLNDVTFHQPKKPPVPEDACILADYMLMADFVAQTGHGLGKLSKGTRCNWASRDFFYDSGTDWALEGPHMAIASGLRTYNNQNEKQIDLPTFGHGFVSRFLANTDRSSNTTYKVNDDVYDTNFNASGTYTAGNRIGTTSPNPWDISANDGTVTFDHNGNGTDAVEFAGIKNLQLGVNNLTFDDNTTDYIVFDGVEVVTPIHTSSHYQTFETPYLHELVGGDRNMEQTNLIVTADGKSWDEVTRDTSYLGPSAIVSASRDGGHKSSANNYDFDYHRGIANKKEMYNKNIAIAFDRFVILEDGIYEVMLHTYNNTAATVIFLQKNSEAGNIDNGVILRAASADDTPNGIVVWELKRYDYVLVRVQNGGTNAMSGANPGYTQIVIKKLD